MVDAKSNRERAIRDVKSNLILDAALKVFSSCGFHSARLEDIAAAAGFSKAALYNYYKDKEEIFLNLTIREYTRLIDRLKQDITSDDSFKQSIERCIRIILTTFGEHSSILLTISNFRMFNLLNDQTLEDYQQYITRFRTVHRSLEKIIESLIDNAKKRAEIRSELDSKTLTSFFGSLVRGIVFEWKVNGKVGNIDNAVHQLLGFIGKGFDIA